LVCDVTSLKAFLVSQKDKILMYDSERFSKIGELSIELLPTKTREKHHIIGMKLSPNEEYLAVISGKLLIMQENHPMQLWMFKKDDHERTFKPYSRIIIEGDEKLRKAFTQVSMDYCFKDNTGPSRDSLFFARADCIFEFNFETKEIRTWC